jgi:hypothetical protein
MKLFKFLFNKNWRQEYSKKFISDFYEINQRIEDIYLEVAKEYNASKEQVA